MSKKPGQKLVLYGRKILFLIYLLPLILPLFSLYFAGKTGNFNQSAWWIIFFLIVLTGVDQLLGKKSARQSGDQLKHEEKKIYYSILVFLGLPAATMLSVCGAYFFSNTDELNWAGRIGWMVALGLPISFMAFCAGHELMHREKRIDRLIGGLLFAFICNAVYNIEHIRGHHYNVATPADSGSANLNQSFYHFFPKALKKAFVNAWRLEKKRLNRKGKSVLSWRNGLISWHLVSLGIAIIYYFFFGLHGIIFFIGQGLIALTMHHIANYIQHYGLKRRKLDNGRYEKFCASHAWSNNFLLSNMVSFQFPHHADHHLHPRRPYQLLQHVEESPQMPIGYFAIFFMALIPPLWFKVVNPHVLKYYRKEEFQKRNEGHFKREMPASFSTAKINE